MREDVTKKILHKRRKIEDFQEKHSQITYLCFLYIVPCFVIHLLITLLFIPPPMVTLCIPSFNFIFFSLTFRSLPYNFSLYIKIYFIKDSEGLKEEKEEE